MFEKEKEELCQAALQIYERKLVSGTDGNISMRLEPDRLLITPSGISKGMLRAEMLLVIDGDGNLLEGELASSREAGMHCGIYKVRPDINAIVHTHPAAATAFAAKGLTLPDNLLIEVPLVLGKMELVPYAAPGSQELADYVKQAATVSSILFLAGHGIITCGKTMTDAFNKMDALENAAQTLIYARLLEGAACISKEDIDKCR